MTFKPSLIFFILLLAVLSGVPLTTRPANAIVGLGVGDPSNTWASYGPDPAIKTLVMHEYGGDAHERNGFVAGEIDVRDTGQTGTGVFSRDYAAYEANPDWLITPRQSSPIFYGIYFNYASSTWAYWGCDWQHGNSACGIEIREAFAHLVDKAGTVNFVPINFGAGYAVPVADDLPASKLNPNGTQMGTPAAAQCAWETTPFHPYSGCISAFNLSPDPGGTPLPGTPDWCAAVDHLIAAGIGLNRDPAAPMDAYGNRCGIAANSPGLLNGAGPIPTHKMRAKVRSTDPRVTVGQHLAAAMDQLMGGVSVVSLQIDRHGTIGPFIVWSCCSPSFPTDDWDWYTYGYQDSGPYPTTLFAILHSQFASNLCGPDTVPGTTQGQLEIFPSNPTFVCVPDIDTALSAMKSAGDLSSAYAYAYQALDIAGRHVQDIPLMSLFVRNAALREGEGWVNAQEKSYENPFNFFTVHKGSYNQVDPQGRYRFGGGDPSTIRYGQAGGGLVTILNPYNSQFSWEFNILDEVYDTLFKANPVDPIQVFCWVCNSYTASVDVSGNTHYLIELRQNLRWQDGLGGSAANPGVGAALDAYDVKFSILSTKDFAQFNSVSGLVGTSLVLSVTALGSNLLDVVMQGQSITQLRDLATVHLVPRHIWELAGDLSYGDVGRPDPAKLDTNYDDVASGTFIGSGPFECRSIFPVDLGRIGTGCVANIGYCDNYPCTPTTVRGGQAIDVGGTIQLTRFDNTGELDNSNPYNQWFRSNNPAWGTGSGTAAQSGQFQEFSWADRYDTGSVTIQDLLSVAACFGKSSSAGCADYSYWLRPAFHPGTPTTITTELAIVASHLDDTWIYPYGWPGAHGQPDPPMVSIVPFTS